jgi:hypothetical protein
VRLQLRTEGTLRAPRSAATLRGESKPYFRGNCTTRGLMLVEALERLERKRKYSILERVV